MHKHHQEFLLEKKQIEAFRDSLRMEMENACSMIKQIETTTTLTASEQTKLIESL